MEETTKKHTRDLSDPPIENTPQRRKTDPECVELEKFLEITPKNEIWQIIMLFLLEMGIVHEIDSIENAFLTCFMVEDNSFILQYCEDPVKVDELESEEIEESDEIDDSDDLPPRRRTWPLGQIYPKRKQIFGCFGKNYYSFQFFPSVLRKHKIYHDFLEKYTEHLYPQLWSNIPEIRETLDLKDPNLKQILIEINKIHGLF